jgi:hypothetical protein
MAEASRLAQLMAEEPRHPWEVMLDAVHTHDVLHRVRREEVLDAPELTAVMLQELDHRATVTAVSSRMAIAEKAHEHIALSFQQRTELEAKLVVFAVEGMVNELVRSLDPRHAEDVRDWCFATARDRLWAAEDGKEIEVKPPPFRLAIAPAIEGEVLSSNPADDEATRDGLDSKDIARDSGKVDLEDRRDTRCRLSSFTIDELADEIERRLEKPDAG